MYLLSLTRTVHICPTSSLHFHFFLTQLFFLPLHTLFLLLHLHSPLSPIFLSCYWYIHWTIFKPALFPLSAFPSLAHKHIQTPRFPFQTAISPNISLDDTSFHFTTLLFILSLIISSTPSLALPLVIHAFCP